MIEKSCENCADYIACWGMGKPQKTVCENWQIDFATFQDLLEEKKITHPNDIEKFTKNLK